MKAGYSRRCAQEGIARGGTRPRKLCIPRPAESGRSHSRRCSSFSHQSCALAGAPCKADSSHPHEQKRRDTQRVSLLFCSWGREEPASHRVPATNRRSVCGGKRTSSGVSETCHSRQGEGYKACEDASRLAHQKRTVSKGLLLIGTICEPWG